MGQLLTVTHNPISRTITEAALGRAVPLARACGMKCAAHSAQVERVSLPQVHRNFAGIVTLDQMVSSQWFAALSVVLILLAAVGVLWMRFVGAQRRERELRLLVAQKTADLQEANEELFFLSFTDPLTSVANRRLFDKLMDRECARIQRMNSYASLLSIDVDHFKLLNDTEGHQKGDECLVALGALLTRLCRRKLDLAARCGGEEFAMILPITNADDALRIAESVRQAVYDLKIPHSASPVEPYLTISIGVATATKDWCSTPDALVAAADRALYAAKREGRNRVSVAPPPQAPSSPGDTPSQS